VDLIIANSEGIQKAALATLGYAGLRIGELEQLQWIDVQFDKDQL
jgi:integrase